MAERHFVPVALLALAATLGGGCASAPSDLVAGIPWIATHEKVSDASVQRLSHHPEVAVDRVSLKELELAADEPELEAERATVLSLLDRAHDLATRTTRSEIDRLSDAEVTSVVVRYRLGRGADRPSVLNAWRRAADQQYDSLRSRIVACASKPELDALVRELHDDAIPSIKDVRYDPGVWSVFAGKSRTAANDLYAEEANGPADRPFADARRYRFDDAGSIPPTAEADIRGHTRDDWALLVRWAPSIVQEVVDPSAHAPSVDVPGRVEARNRGSIEVDSDHPTLYAYSRHVPIAGIRHTQLVYTLWYPESVAGGAIGDVEAGHLEGVTLRATLDPQREHPILFETLDACGCFHRIYPTRSLADAAERQYGASLQREPENGAVCGDGPKDLLLGRVIPDPTGGDRPVIRCSAGNHGIVDVDFEEAGGNAPASTALCMAAYDELEHLRTPGGGWTSMFHENGLVKGAQRKEGMYFVPMGILSAGQPRQRGTQLILFDDWDFDDPDLFPHALRWPKLGTRSLAADTPIALRSTAVR